VRGERREIEKETLSKIDKPKVLTYLRLSKRHLGLIINFYEELLRDGVHGVVNNLKEQV